MNIVHGYSIRKLSFLDDVSAAFADIISTMSQSFSGGFIYGLPEMFFDVALLWELLHNSERCDSHHLGCSSDQFPSWSWMGWIGEVDPDSWKSG
jgi:hypothetical protein